MDRLKAMYIKNILEVYTNLHSSMDRLKGNLQATQREESPHLHSSMDRLKGLSMESRPRGRVFE